MGERQAALEWLEKPCGCTIQDWRTPKPIRSSILFAGSPAFKS